MAHDLRNILQMISGNLRMLSRQLGHDTAAMKHIERAMHGVDLGTELAGHALEHGSRRLRQSACIRSAASALEGMLAEVAGDGVSVHLVAPADLKPARVHLAELQNALVNLTINARDAMKGSGTMRVTFSNAVEDGRDWIDMVVSDDGCGMPPHVLERAFDPFFTTKGSDGSGLGLATVRRFAEDCDGSVRAMSRLGEGTTFIIRMPASPS